jgi:ABC-type multidrug transport system fused ATPase/permease subunit
MFNRLKKIGTTLSNIGQTLSNLSPYVFTRKNARLLGLAGLATISGFALDFIFADALASTVSYVLMGGEASIMGLEVGGIFGMVGSTVAAYALKGYTATIKNLMLAPMPPRAVSQLFTRYGTHALARSLEEQREAKLGDDITRIQKGFGAMYGLSGNLFSQGVPLLLGTPVSTAIIGWKYGLSIGLGAAAVVAVSAGYGMSTTNTNAEYREKSRVTGNDAFDAMEESLTYTRTIQINNSQAKSIREVKDAHELWEQAESKSLRYNIEIEAKVNTITNIGLLLLMFKTVHDISKGNLEKTTFPAIFALLSQSFSMLSATALTFCQMVSSAVDLKAVFDYLNKKTSTPERDKTRKLEIKADSAEVKFDHVTVKFGNGKTALEDVSCVFPAGKTTAIVGHSGSGKSTMLNVLTQFYDQEEGEVWVDRENTREFSRTEIRSIMSTVSQKPDLFHESIADNIRRGVERKLTDEEVMTAIKQASLFEFVSKQKDGVNTDVGLRGEKLSGGEAQRVAIARALARHPKILILDEATSALDEKTAGVIMQEILQIEGLTKIMVTHRMREAQKADHILFFKEGRLVEAGTHEQLLKLEGEYAALWNEQNKTKTEAKESEIAHSPRLFQPVMRSAEPVSNDVTVEIAPRENKHQDGPRLIVVRPAGSRA